jgi:hypothetical protein
MRKREVHATRMIVFQCKLSSLCARCRRITRKLHARQRQPLKAIKAQVKPETYVWLSDIAGFLARHCARYPTRVSDPSPERIEQRIREAQWKTGEDAARHLRDTVGIMVSAPGSTAQGNGNDHCYAPQQTDSN